MNERSPLRRWSVAAPWCALPLLAALSWALPNRVTINEASQHRKVEIAAAMQAVPLFIGDWVGRDWEVPPEAQELLRPNAILSRQYQRPGEANLHVLVVHCSDARDMIGHYPPICYPSSGWVRTQPERDDGVLEVGGWRLPVRVYRFHRARNNGVEETIRILNAFVLPDGTVTRDIGDINRQSERLAVSVQGVAQLQVISAADARIDDVQRDAGELLEGMAALLEALGVKATANGGRSDA